MAKVVKNVKKFKALEELNIKPLSNVIRTSIETGLASAAPPLGPILGKYGINISNFCKDFNEKTKHFKPGIPLSVNIAVNPDRSYKLSMSTPLTSFFIMQAAGITTLKIEENDVSGKISIKHVYEIAKLKIKDYDLSWMDLDQICNLIIDEARTMGVEVVRDLPADEYQQFLVERRIKIEEHKKLIEEVQAAKLARTAD